MPYGTTPGCGIRDRIKGDDALINISGGDARKLLNLLEVVAEAADTRKGASEPLNSVEGRSSGRSLPMRS